MKPERIIAFGKEAVRGIFTAIVAEKVKGFGVSKTMEELSEKSRGGLELQADGWHFRLHVSPFPLGNLEQRKTATGILSEAAKLSAVIK